MSAITAACSALEVTLYVSNDFLMFTAASWALAHSGAPPLGTGALAQDCDLGAMVVIWDAVIPVSLPVVRVGRAVDRTDRERMRKVLGMCILIWLVVVGKLGVKDSSVVVLRIVLQKWAMKRSKKRKRRQMEQRTEKTD